MSKDQELRERGLKPLEKQHSVSLAPSVPRIYTIDELQENLEEDRKEALNRALLEEEYNQSNFEKMKEGIPIPSFTQTSLGGANFFEVEPDSYLSEKVKKDIRDDIEAQSEILGLSEEEKRKQYDKRIKQHIALYGYTDPLSGESVYGKQKAPARRQIEAISEQPSSNKANYKFSENILASYYSGVESLDLDSRQQLNELFGDNFANGSSYVQNFYLKANILKDLCENSQDPEIRGIWEVAKNLSARPDDVKKMDELFNYVYIKEKDRVFRKASWWEGLEANFTDSGDEVLNLYPSSPSKGDMTDSEYANSLLGRIENGAPWEEKHKKRISKTTNKRNLQITEDQVYASLDSASEENVGLNKTALNRLTETEKQETIDSFKEYSRQLSPTKFKEYEGTYLVNLTPEDYLDLIAKYNSDANIGGRAYADQRLQNFYQDLVADNQSEWEKLGHTIAQFGTIVGTQVGGLLAPLAWASGRAIKGDNFVDEYRGMKEYLSGVRATGELRPEAIEQRLNDGTQRFAILNTVEQDNSYLHLNTPYELGSQAGYIAGFAAAGSMVSKGIGLAAKGITNTTRWFTGTSLNSLATISPRIAKSAEAFASHAGQVKFNLGAIKFQNAAQLLTIPITTEMEAFDEAHGVKHDFMRSAAQTIEAKYNQKYEEDVSNAIGKNLHYYASEYSRQTGIPVGHLETVDDLGNRELVYTNKEISNIINYFLKDQDLKNRYFNSIQTSIDNEMALAERAATAGAQNTFIIDMAIGTVLHTSLKKSLLPAPVRRLVSDRKTLADIVDITFKNGKWQASIKNFTKKEILGSMALEATGEFIEEFSQALSSIAGRSYAQSTLDQLMYKRYANNKSNSALDYSISESMAAGLDSAVSEFFSRETLQGGLYGALSSLLGMPTVKNVNISKKSNRETWAQYAKRINFLGWRSPFTLPFSSSEVVDENKRRQEVADFIQTYLDESNHYDLFMNAGIAASTMQKLAMAEASGDEKALRDARLEAMQESVAFLATMQGTEFYSTVMSTLNSRVGFKEENLADPNSQESKAVQEYYSEGGVHKNVSPQDALQEIVKASRDMLQVINATQTQVSKVKKDYGEDIDPELLHDIVYNRIVAEDKKKRYTQLNKEIEEIVSDGVNAGTFTRKDKSKLSTRAKNFLARYGSLQEAENAIDRYKKEIDETIRRIKKSSLTAKEKRQHIAELNKAIEDAQLELEEVTEELAAYDKNEKTLSAEEILQLTPKERAMMIDSKGSSLEQKREISRITANKNLTRKIIDAGRLYQEHQRALAIDMELMANPAYYGQYHRKVKQAALARRIKSKYSYLNNENYDYETFRQEFFNAWNSLEDIDSARLLLDTVKDSPHAERFAMEQAAFAQIRQKIIESAAYQKLGKDERNNLFALLDALYQYQVPISFDTSTEDMMRTVLNLPEGKFEQLLRRQDSFEGETSLLPFNSTVANLRTILDELEEDQKVITRRQSSYDLVDASLTDNNPAMPEETSSEEEQQEEESDEETSPLDSVKTVYEDEFNKGSFADIPQGTRDLSLNMLDSWFKKALEDITSELEGSESLEQMKTLFENLAFEEKNQILRAGVRQVIDRVFDKLLGTTTSTEASVQHVQLEGHTGKREEFMRKHKSFETLAREPITNNTSIYFYTPEELLEEDSEQELPVVALIQSDSGTITIKGVKYSPIGYVSPSSAMLAENSSRKGNFLYTQTARVNSVSKEWFDPSNHKHTPVRDVLESAKISIAKFVSKLQKITGVKDGKQYSQLAYPLSRGRGTDVIYARLFVEDISSYTNSKGKTVIDYLKEFREVLNRYNSADETSREQLDNEVRSAASSVVVFNYYTERAITKTARSLNDIVSKLLKRESLESIEKAVSTLYEDFTHYLSLSGYKNMSFSISNVAYDTEGNLSFDVNLKDLNGEMTLVSFTGLNSMRGPAYKDIVEMLASMALYQNGNVRSATGDTGSFIKYNVNYTDENGNINISTVKHAIEDGIMYLTHSNLNYTASEISFTYDISQKADYSLQQEIEDDNAAPVRRPSDSIETSDGKEVNPDTGLSQQEEEETQVEPEEEDEDEDPFADYEDYQLITPRETILKEIRSEFESLLFDEATRQDYENWNKETEEELREYTSPNVFLIKKNETLEDVRKRAEKKANEIRGQKRENIKSIVVEPSSKAGYHLRITYRTFSDFLHRKTNSLTSLPTSALMTLRENLNNRNSVIQTSQKVKKAQLKLFSSLKESSLYAKYKEAMRSPVNTKLEALLSRIVKAYNFRIVEKSLKRIHGHDVAGALDTLGKVIYLAKEGERNSLTEAEEVSHMIIDMINTATTNQNLVNLYNTLLEIIEETDFYKEALSTYKTVYKDFNTGETDYSRIKNEAISKALATALMDKYTKPDTLKAKITSMVENVVHFFKSLLQKSGLTSGVESILHTELNSLIKEAISPILKAEERVSTRTSISTYLKNLVGKISDKYVESKEEAIYSKARRELMESSAQVSINYDYLSNDVKELLLLKRIEKEQWDACPRALQEILIRCATK